MEIGAVGTSGMSCRCCNRWIEVIDLTGENNGTSSINHEATTTSDMNISRNNAVSRTSVGRTNRERMVTDLTGENDGTISVSVETTAVSDVNTITSGEESIANFEDIIMDDEDMENMSVSDEADTDTDATSQDSSDDDYQPDEEPAPRRYSTSVDMDVDSWLDEWPDQAPVPEDLKVSHSKQRRTTALARSDMQQDIPYYWESIEDCLIPKLRHSQKFRDEVYGKASIHEILVVYTQVQPSERHIRLPSAFDWPRGRPYEIICERVWDSWRKLRRDRSIMDAISSIERGGSWIQRNWPNAGPAMLRFPEHRIRHKKTRRN